MSLSDRLPTWLAGEADELDENHVAGHILMVIVAALLMRMGFRLWAVNEPMVPAMAAGIMLLFAVGVQLLVFAATDIDLSAHGRRIALAVLGAMLTAALLSIWTAGGFARFGTDSILFVRRSVDLLLSGTNPYEASMHPGFDRPGYGASWATPRIDGSIASRLAYPAGAVLAHVPAAVVGIPIRATAVVGAAAAAWLVIRETPPALAFAPLAALLGMRNLMLTGAGGVWDAVWLPFALLGLRAVYRDRLGESGFWVAVAGAMKQHVWFIAPFVFVRRLALGQRRAAARYAVVGTVTFAAINAPFALWNPQAWVRGTFAQVAGEAPMVPQGVGATLLSMTEVYPVTSGWHELALAALAVVLLTATALYPEQVGFGVWVFAPALLFFHYRSLASYFAWPLLVGVHAVLATHGALEVRPFARPTVAGVRTRVREVVGRAT